MPEISEVRLTSEFVTRKNRNRKIIDVEYLSSNKLKDIENIDESEELYLQRVEERR